jgi:hypothetical protein
MYFFFSNLSSFVSLMYSICLLSSSYIYTFRFSIAWASYYISSSLMSLWEWPIYFNTALWRWLAFLLCMPLSPNSTSVLEFLYYETNIFSLPVKTGAGRWLFLFFSSRLNKPGVEMSVLPSSECRWYYPAGFLGFYLLLLSGL